MWKPDTAAPASESRLLMLTDHCSEYRLPRTCHLLSMGTCSQPEGTHHTNVFSLMRQWSRYTCLAHKDHVMMTIRRKRQEHLYHHVFCVFHVFIQPSKLYPAVTCRTREGQTHEVKLSHTNEFKEHLKWNKRCQGQASVMKSQLTCTFYKLTRTKPRQQNIPAS